MVCFSNATTPCSKWVYSKEYYEVTVISEVSQRGTFGKHPCTTLLKSVSYPRTRVVVVVVVVVV